MIFFGYASSIFELIIDEYKLKIYFHLLRYVKTENICLICYDIVS